VWRGSERTHCVDNLVRQNTKAVAALRRRHHRRDDDDVLWGTVSDDLNPWVPLLASLLAERDDAG
jgi:hypothetical protein